MDLTVNIIRDLVNKGKTQGYLTFTQVSAAFSAVNISSVPLADIIQKLDQYGIDFLEKAPENTSIANCLDVLEDDDSNLYEEENDSVFPDDEESSFMEEENSRSRVDPVRMYLTQMGANPLLSRDDEMELAKKIEKTRRRFRQSMLGCYAVMRSTVNTLRKIHRGILSFDRAIKTSKTERLSKEQIQARMPQNLRTLEILLERCRCDFRLMTKRTTPGADKRAARERFLATRKKMLVLVEELSLRNKKIYALLEPLEQMSRRMCEIREKLRGVMSGETSPG